MFATVTDLRWLCIALIRSFMLLPSRSFPRLSITLTNACRPTSEELKMLLELVLLLAYSALSLFLLINQSLLLTSMVRQSLLLRRFSWQQTICLLVDVAILSAAMGMSLIVAGLWFRYLNDLPMLENIYPSLIHK